MRTRHLALAGLLLLVAATAAAQEPSGWVLTTDYSTFGRVRSFGGNDPWTVSGDLAVIPGDATGVHRDGLLYILGRGQSNLLQVWDPADWSLEYEAGLGSGLNPQDLAFDAEGDAYVSCYDAALLLRIDPSDGSVLDSYDTSIFADADGLPETARMATVGDRLYIACQRLDRDNFYSPTGPGAVLVFDMAAETWVDVDPQQAGIQPIALQGANPYTRIQAYGSKLAVGCTGYFGLADGGVETVDPVSGLSEGYLVTGAELGGDINRLQVDGADLVLVTNDASFATAVQRWSAGSVQLLDLGTGFVHADILVQGGWLFVADRTVGADGLRVVHPVTGVEQTSSALATGLGPFLFVPAEDPPLSGVGVPRGAAALALGAPYPNPCNPAVVVPLMAAPGAQVLIDVFDLRGRRVGSKRVTADAEGHARYRSRGLDRQGRPLAAGVYQVRARSGTATAVTRFTLVK